MAVMVHLEVRPVLLEIGDRFGYGLAVGHAHNPKKRPVIGALLARHGRQSHTSCLQGISGCLNRPGFDAAIFCEKDSDYAQAVPSRPP
jgi:hypothetical protein